MNKSNIVSSSILAGFFILFFLYILIIVNPAINNFIQQSIFLFDIEFLKGFLSHPGGIIEYISQFLSQFFFSSWLGALIITAIAILTWQITKKICKAVNLKTEILIISLLPSIALLFLYTNNNHIIDTDLILLSTIICYYIFLIVKRKKDIFKIPTLFIAAISLFYIAGGAALLLYLALVLLTEIADFNNYKSILIILLSCLICLVIPYLSVIFVFNITFKQAYFHLLKSIPYYQVSFITYFLYLYYPFLVILSIVLNIKIFKNLVNKLIQNQNNVKPLILIRLPIVIVFTFLAISLAKQPEQKLIYKIKYLAYNDKWNEVLELAKENPSNDRFVNFHTNRALYHTGKLTTDMFKYPQNWGKHALLLGEIVNRTILLDNSDVYYDMGHIRAAEHWVYEAQTIFENSPRVLKRLAMTNMILEKYKPAKSILHILSKSIIHKKWANKYLEAIENNTLTETDTTIQNIRNLLPVEVFFMSRINPDIDLTMLLERNPQNKMAYEYLSTYYLLSNNLIGFIGNMKYLKPLGYAAIPKIYEEAVLVYVTKKGLTKINLGGYTISEKTQNNYTDYAQTIFKHNNNLQAAKEELYNRHGDTYWYYIHFNSPVTNKKELKSVTIDE